MNAIAPDQQIGFDSFDRRSTGPITEFSPNLTRCLTEFGQMVTGAHTIRAESGEHGSMEDSEQLAAMDGYLRPVIPGGGSTRLAPAPLPVLVEQDELGGADTGCGQVIEQTELRKLAHGVRHDIDADAQFSQRRSGFEDGEIVDAGIVQRQREGEAANTATSDRDTHIGAPPQRS
jgi:hypothetical protein